MSRLIDMDISEQAVLAFLRQIETGEVILTPTLDPQIHIKSDILYEASNGWAIEISNWSGEFSGIVEIRLPDDRILDMDFLEENMPNVCLYFPDKNVEWQAYKMKKIIIGYIYRAEGKRGIDYGLRCTLMGHRNTRPEYGDGGSLTFRRSELLKIVHLSK